MSFFKKQMMTHFTLTKVLLHFCRPRPTQWRSVRNAFLFFSFSSSLHLVPLCLLFRLFSSSCHLVWGNGNQNSPAEISCSCFERIKIQVPSLSLSHTHTGSRNLLRIAIEEVHGEVEWGFWEVLEVYDEKKEKGLLRGYFLGRKKIKSSEIWTHLDSWGKWAIFVIAVHYKLKIT